MKQEEIEKRIKKGKADFYHAKYDGKVPEKLTEYFKAALFAVAPSNDNIPTETLKGWISTPIDELNFLEVSKMAEIIIAVPRDKVFLTFEEAVEELGIIEMIMKDVNEKINSFNIKQNAQRIAWENETGTVKDKKIKSKKEKPQMASV